MKLYRYTDHRVASSEEDRGRCAIYLTEYQVTKETTKGYWIGTVWVSKTSKKRYAYPSKDEAWASFQARKKRQILILSTRLAYAQEAARTSRP